MGERSHDGPRREPGQAPAGSRARRAAGRDAPRGAPFLALQQTAGNRAVQRLLSGKRSTPGAHAAPGGLIARLLGERTSARKPEPEGRPPAESFTRADLPGARVRPAWLQRTPEQAVAKAAELGKKEYKMWADVKQDRKAFDDKQWTVITDEYHKGMMPAEVEAGLGDNAAMHKLFMTWASSKFSPVELKTAQMQAGSFTGGGQCEFFSKELQQHLKGKAQVEVREATAFGITHFFVAVSGPWSPTAQTIIEPTWKQFPMTVLRQAVSAQLGIDQFGELRNNSPLLRHLGNDNQPGKLSQESIQKNVSMEVDQLLERSASSINGLPHVFVGNFNALSALMTQALATVTDHYLGSLFGEGIVKQALNLDKSAMKGTLETMATRIYKGK